MTAQTDHQHTPPPMRTIAELRIALRAYGFPGDPASFEAELDAAELDDLTAVREIAQAYRHRVLLALDPAGMAQVIRSTDDVTTELQRKMAQARGR
ncbi:hypothetical protein GTY65_34195 [Streptomyces sp. SID8379]|uniref:hypothetical protein n=1 Tax=unclassified Streptomyces TaxID=2593676 RepID=UPI00038060EA|nr:MULTISPECIES: hypothetical protein [unclassified Streptomyces]MYW69088.1 hypothetical protein [Streptomyces sp. SID8379]